MSTKASTDNNPQHKATFVKKESIEGRSIEGDVDHQAGDLSTYKSGEESAKRRDVVPSEARGSASSEEDSSTKGDGIRVEAQT
ncbi:hypothetical protein AOQ84DRAFT_389435 [Glonium stellatum]|uniref:Uncharacterized protein n=1 Tax=Glonium stellatum TaxID=574774 RepID=A0A8E2F074_9PEZI|nr:hypothetical protein AOQ84DRAFT_389435 [Glonium stellatum]